MEEKVWRMHHYYKAINHGICNWIQEDNKEEDQKYDSSMR